MEEYIQSSHVIMVFGFLGPSRDKVKCKAKACGTSSQPPSTLDTVKFIGSI